MEESGWPLRGGLGGWCGADEEEEEDDEEEEVYVRRRGFGVVRAGV